MPKAFGADIHTGQGHERFHPGERISGGNGMNGGELPIMPGIHRLKHI